MMPNNLQEAISAIGLNKNERKVVDLIVRYTYGVTTKIGSERFYNGETVLTQADIARISKFDATRVKKALTSLVSKEVILLYKNGNKLTISINENLANISEYKEPEHTELLGRNIRKLKLEADAIRKQKLTESATQNRSISPVERQSFEPKYSKDRVNTTKTVLERSEVELKLIKFLKGVDTIKSPEGYLSWIIDEYGTKYLGKLITLDFRLWKNFLDDWKKNEK